MRGMPAANARQSYADAKSSEAEDDLQMMIIRTNAPNSSVAQTRSVNETQTGVFHANTEWEEEGEVASKKATRAYNARVQVCKPVASKRATRAYNAQVVAGKKWHREE